MFKGIKNYINYKKCTKNYERKLAELRATVGSKPIKVLFLVRENSKWSYQSLYEEMISSSEFEPLVVVSMLWLSHIGKDKTRANISEDFEFFSKKGINVDYAYKNGSYVDLREFNPDIVFYDQPWDLPEIHRPEMVSEFALTCYVPYGFSIGLYKKDYTQDFHKLLYKMFLEHDYLKLRYEKMKKGNSKNCFVSGYPKLDSYLEPIKTNEGIWKDSSKFKIIYAPHHSFEKNGLNMATFKKNGRFILEFAQKHPETTWVFKPHPRFKYALLKNDIMTESEIEEYYREWESVGKICTTGDYFDIFKTSDLLITDGCSFLAEYMPTGNPIIQLMNKKPLLSELGNMLLEGCYSLVGNQELDKVLDQLIVKKIDEKKEKRKEIVNKSLNNSPKACLEILKELDINIRN